MDVGLGRFSKRKLHDTSPPNSPHPPITLHHVPWPHGQLHQNTTLHITSHRIASRHIASHRIASHQFTSITSHHIHHVTWNHITPHDVTSHHITSHPSRHVTSHHVTSHHLTSQPTFTTNHLRHITSQLTTWHHRTWHQSAPAHHGKTTSHHQNTETRQNGWRLVRTQKSIAHCLVALCAFLPAKFLGNFRPRLAREQIKAMLFVVHSKAKEPSWLQCLRFLKMWNYSRSSTPWKLGGAVAV